MADVKREHVICAVVLLGAAGLGFAAVRKSGGTGETPGTTESMYGTPTPNAPVLLEEQHLGPVMYTAHRYPRMAGQEISTLLHHGWSAASIPASPEDSWMIKPPSEVTL